MPVSCKDRLFNANVIVMSSCRSALKPTPILKFTAPLWHTNQLLPAECPDQQYQSLSLSAVQKGFQAEPSTSLCRKIVRSSPNATTPSGWFLFFNVLPRSDVWGTFYFPTRSCARLCLEACLNCQQAEGLITADQCIPETTFHCFKWYLLSGKHVNFGGSHSVVGHLPGQLCTFCIACLIVGSAGEDIHQLMRRIWSMLGGKHLAICNMVYLRVWKCHCQRGPFSKLIFPAISVSGEYTGAECQPKL